MKYLRKQTSTEYNPVEGVVYNSDAKTISYISPTSQDFPGYFTVYPLNDGTLTIKAYFKGKRPASNITFFPSTNITIDYLSSNSSWTSIILSDDLLVAGHFVTKTIPLVAGQPIKLKSSTGLCVQTSSTLVIGQDLVNYYPGSITSDCPCIILGSLASLVTGTAYNGNWTQYDYAFRGLFKDWINLIDASNLELPTSISGLGLIPDYTGLFENCSSLTAGPKVTWTNSGSNYTNFFRNCYSLGEVYTTITQASNSTITGWLEGTELGARKMHVMEDFDSYDAFNTELPSNWEIVNDIEES